MLQNISVKYGRSDEDMFYRYKYRNGVFLLFEESEITDGKCFVCTKKKEDTIISHGKSQPTSYADIEPNVETFEEVNFREETFR